MECIKEIEDVDFPIVFNVVKGMDLILTERRWSDCSTETY